MKKVLCIIVSFVILLGLSNSISYAEEDGEYLPTRHVATILYTKGIDPVSDIVVDKDGSVYVTRPSGLYKYESKDNHRLDFSHPENLGFVLECEHVNQSVPSGLFLTKAGDIICTNKHCNQVRIYQDDKVKLSFELPWEPEEKFPYPSDAVQASDGTIYVNDKNNYKVIIFDPEGDKIGVLGEGTYREKVCNAQWMTINSQDYIYIGTGEDPLVIYDDQGKFVRSSGAWYEVFNGVCVDKEDRVYGADHDMILFMYLIPWAIKYIF